jgi:hypothetical protein
LYEAEEGSRDARNSRVRGFNSLRKGEVRLPKKDFVLKARYYFVDS